MKPSFQKYIPFKQIDIPDRTWPNNVIDRAPVWCSVDLRDGNQALVDPMTLKEKLEFFHALVDMGFKEIEIGFPSASETEYEICRELIENNHIPDDVTIQVLVQAREHLIRKTFEAIKGAKNVIVHFYNSTSTLQRKVVFKTDMQGVIDIAVEGAKLIKKLTDEYTGDTNIRFEYSPESFSGTEPDNAVAICDRVMEELGSTKENPVILNLPNTVEMCTPNTYRGCGVAAGELALLAGAERVEGTLFGNGERTGNMDIVTMGLNMFTQGVDPKLDFSNLPKLRDIYERCTNMTHDRRPASALHRRAGIHRVLGLAPGCYQQGLSVHEGKRHRLLGNPLPADRSRGRWQRVRADHPHQLTVRQGRRGVRHEQQLWLRPAQAHAPRILEAGSGKVRGSRARAYPEGAV